MLNGDMDVGGGVVQPLPQDAYVAACDYVRWRLSTREHFDWATCPELPEPDRVRLVMRTLCEQFETRYAVVLADMVEQLGPVEPHTAYPTFMHVAESLFSDGVNHGRVVALFAFGGVLAGRLCRQSPQLVGTVADWIAVFFESRLATWLQANGGWRTMIEFYERQRQWPDWKTVTLGVGAVVSAVTLGRMLSG